MPSAACTPPKGRVDDDRYSRGDDVIDKLEPTPPDELEVHTAEGSGRALLGSRLPAKNRRATRRSDDEKYLARLRRISCTIAPAGSMILAAPHASFARKAWPSWHRSSMSFSVTRQLRHSQARPHQSQIQCRAANLNITVRRRRRPWLAAIQVKAATHRYTSR